MFDHINARLASYEEMNIPGYDCLVYKDGEEIFRRKYLYQGNEHLYLYSCTKPVTAVAALQLYEKGLFTLDTPLADIIPEYAEMTVLNPDGTVRPAKNLITMRNVFTMTAGFSYHSESPVHEKVRAEKGEKMSTLDFVRCKASDPLLYEPGEGWRYSYSTDILGGVVEVLSGQRLGDYAKEHIFDPLGMNETCYVSAMRPVHSDVTLFRYKKDPETGEGRYVDLGFDMSCAVDKQYPARQALCIESGGGGIASTVTDYMKFAEAWRIGDVILGNETTKLMGTDFLTDVQRAAKNTTFPTSGYGYGLTVRVPDSTDPDVTDIGWGGAAGSFIAVDRVHNMSLVFGMHVMGQPNKSTRIKLIQDIKKDLGIIKEE